MSDRWILTGAAFRTFAFEYIEEGFESTIDLSAHSVNKENGQLAWFDDGEIYDIYRSRFTAVMTPEDLNALQVVYNFNRDSQYTLAPETTGRGFALFTPAFGDVGPFTFKIKSFRQSGTLNDERYLWYRVSFEVELSGSLPTYSPSPVESEGNWNIGTIFGLRYPLTNFQSEVFFDVVLDGGQKIRYNANVETSVKRPDGFHVKFNGDLAKRRVWYDGKNLTIFNPDLKFYARADTKPTIDGALEHVSENLGITPPHRGKGLGSGLLRHALLGFREIGLRRAFLEVTAQNSGALRLYQRLGFRRVRTVYKAAEVAYA